MKKRTRKVNVGMAAPAAVVKKMRGIGYAPVGTAAAEFKVPATTVRTWVAGWMDDAKEGNTWPGKPRAFKSGSRVWVLLDAVAKRAAPALPAGVAS